MVDCSFYRCENCQYTIVESEGETCFECLEHEEPTCRFCDEPAQLTSEGISYCTDHWDYFGPRKTCPHCNTVTSVYSMSKFDDKYCGTCAPEKCVTCEQTVSVKKFGSTQCMSCLNYKGSGYCPVCKTNTLGKTVDSFGVCERCETNPRYKNSKAEKFTKYGI